MCFQQNEGLSWSLHWILWKLLRNIVESWVVVLGSGVWRMDPPGMWPAPNTHTSHRLWTLNVVKVWPRSPAHHRPLLSSPSSGRSEEKCLIKWGYWHSSQCSLCALWFAEKFELVSYLFSIIEIWIWILIVCGKEKAILLLSFSMEFVEYIALQCVCVVSHYPY